MVVVVAEECVFQLEETSESFCSTIFFSHSTHTQVTYNNRFSVLCV